MNVQDIVGMMDKKYGRDLQVCPNEGKPAKLQCGQIREEHGAMGVHASGAFLICGVCGAKAPTSLA
jgi:hypothetical protein